MRLSYLLFICSCYTISYSQEYPVKGNSETGISLGLYTGQLREGFSSIGGSTSAIGAAIQYERYLSDRWGVKGKLQYDPKGIDGLKLNFLTIPIMANWHFGKNRRWNLQFGPYYGYLISLDSELVGLRELYHSSDVGFDLGIGYKFPIGGKWIFIESDGQTPFSDPLKNSSSDFVLSRNALSIGLIF